MIQPSRRPTGPEMPDAADYISSIVEELARLAKSLNLDALAYILDMARLEADQAAQAWSRRHPEHD
jgi:hypothetical protein